MRKALLVAVGLSVLASPVHAACTQDDLIGRFLAYTVSSSGVITYATAARCVIDITSNTGNLTPGAACFQLFQDGRKIHGSVSSGNLQIANSCRVTGQWTISGQPSAHIRIEEARLGVAKNNISGVGQQDTHNLITFSAVRVQ